MIARVVISSPLPQLDRLFDYSIPEALLDFVVRGVRVKVPFGRSKGTLDGFVVEVLAESSFEGKLSEISELVSPVPVLDSGVYELVRAVADRQASTASDVLRLAIPDRSVAVEKRWQESQTLKPHSQLITQGKRESAITEPVTNENGAAWVQQIVEATERQFKAGRSSIIVVPDFRDQDVLLTAFSQTECADVVVDYSSTLQKSKRYNNFLKCLSNEVSIVIGSRSAIYAPVRSLGLIAMWDDGDQSHNEPTSPYSHSREVALIRQKLSNCNLLFLGHSRSTEVQRLISLKFVSDITQPFRLPKIANSDSALRVDSLAWNAIRLGLETGAVLVQVASRGNSSSAFCAECERRAECRFCNGPLWIDERSQPRCRWCNAVNLDHSCHSCSATKLKLGTAGASRTAAEFGRAFPGIRVIEATGEDKQSLIDKGKFLVVATPGAEPRVAGGYSAVVLLDAHRALNRDSLRATEDAVRQWSNAIALGSSSSRNVLVGVPGALATKFSLWSQSDIAAHELASRVELRFPPAIRLASIGANKELIQEVVTNLAQLGGLEILGPLPVSEQGVEKEWRVLIKYEFSEGPKLAEALKALSLKLSAGNQRFSARSGRALRPIRIKMDDVEVI
jgi:primosomal protein N' (replication factor Y)